MATALAKKPCAKCQKGVGVTTCDGCQQSFCIKHIIEHRQELGVQMDNIGQEYDSLPRDLFEKNLIHPLLLRINEWEQESIKKIQMAADAARADLQQLFNQMKSVAKTSVDKIADELQTHRELDDYTEIDLIRWSAKLTEVRKLLEAPSTIEIVKDKNISTAIHLIKVYEQKQLHLPSKSAQVSEKSLLPSHKLVKSTQEKFDKAMDLISLSEGGLLATYTNTHCRGYKTIIGKNSYHSGVHHIHFRIENKGTDNFFFGITTSSRNIVSDIFNEPTANGWWDLTILLLMVKDKNSAVKKSFK